MIIARALLHAISEIDSGMGDSKTVRGQLDHLACATGFLTNWSGIAREEPDLNEFLRKSKDCELEKCVAARALDFRGLYDSLRTGHKQSSAKSQVLANVGSAVLAFGLRSVTGNQALSNSVWFNQDFTDYSGATLLGLAQGQPQDRIQIYHRAMLEKHTELFARFDDLYEQLAMQRTVRAAASSVQSNQSDPDPSFEAPRMDGETPM